MFLNFQSKPTKFKHTIYLIASTILGILLSFIAHAIIEISYINYALTRGIIIVNHGVFGHAYCALPAWLQIGLLLLGIIGGFWLGQFWWRKIYIEKIWAK